MDARGQAPGFFGKVPSHGDFVGRRLPPEVRRCFDDWLQAGLLRSKEDLGRDWLPTWLSSPIWRFVVGAGVCGEQAWAGVMMPSHDRVGRCFPLLLAAGVNGTPSLRDCLALHDGWFGQLEELALSSLEAGFAVQSFDAGLLAIGAAPHNALSASSFVSLGGRQAYGVVAPLSVALLTNGLPTFANESLDGGSAWWSEGTARVGSCLATCRRLPSSATFAALLDGRWTEHGWCHP